MIPTRSATCCTSSSECDERKTVRRRGGLAEQRRELLLHQRVEPARRFVEEEHVGPVHERLARGRPSAGCPSRVAGSAGRARRRTARQSSARSRRRAPPRSARASRATPRRSSRSTGAGRRARSRRGVRLDGSTPRVDARARSRAGGRADQPEQEPRVVDLPAPFGRGTRTPRPVRPEVEVGERSVPGPRSASRASASRSASRRTWASIVCRWRPRPVRLAESRTQWRRPFGRLHLHPGRSERISGRCWPLPS